MNIFELNTGDVVLLQWNNSHLRYEAIRLNDEVVLRELDVLEARYILYSFLEFDCLKTCANMKIVEIVKASDYQPIPYSPSPYAYCVEWDGYGNGGDGAPSILMSTSCICFAGRARSCKAHND